MDRIRSVLHRGWKNPPVLLVYCNLTMRRDKSFADDLIVHRGVVSGRVALLLRSAETKPLMPRFVPSRNTTCQSNRRPQSVRPSGTDSTVCGQSGGRTAARQPRSGVACRAIESTVCTHMSLRRWRQAARRRRGVGVDTPPVAVRVCGRLCLYIAPPPHQWSRATMEPGDNGARRLCERSDFARRVTEPTFRSAVSTTATSPARFSNCYLVAINQATPDPPSHLPTFPPFPPCTPRYAPVRLGVRRAKPEPPGSSDLPADPSQPGPPLGKPGAVLQAFDPGAAGSNQPRGDCAGRTTKPHVKRRQKKSNYGTRDSRMVTHCSTNLAIPCLTRAERTGSRAFMVL